MQLRRGPRSATSQLEQDILSFNDQHNDDPQPYRWTKCADEILASVQRFWQATERTLCGEL
jgi:hypothetical protein